jgi:hypothetical protein
LAARIHHRLGDSRVFAITNDIPQQPGCGESTISLAESRQPQTLHVKPSMKARGKVFISYRREGGAELARLVRDSLLERGYNVFMDVEDLRSGLFNTAAFKQIESSTDVVVVLTPGSLDRCTNEHDWVRLEVAHAIKCKKNIVPVMASGFSFPSTPLPGDLSELPNHQGIEPSHNYFRASMDKLASLLVGSPRPRVRRIAVMGALLAAIVFACLLLWIGAFRERSKSVAEPVSTNWISLAQFSNTLGIVLRREIADSLILPSSPLKSSILSPPKSVF